MKYQNENEMCKDVTELIMGLLIDETKNGFQCIAEVPKNYFSNDHFDMVIIDRDNYRVLPIEYKLTGFKGLLSQINRSAFMKPIGIINSNIKVENRKWVGAEQIFCYTGKDAELDFIYKRLSTMNNTSRFWHSAFDPWAIVLWFAYMGKPNNLNGGVFTGERKTFHKIFIDAVINLQKQYNNKLDWFAVNAILRCGYSDKVSKKYYNIAMKKLKDGK